MYKCFIRGTRRRGTKIEMNLNKCGMWFTWYLCLADSLSCINLVTIRFCF